MSIPLASFFVPKNNNTFFLLEDKYVKGGLRSCVDHAERDAINPLNRKPGMIAVTQIDKKLWTLADDKITWSELSLNGAPKIRQSLVHTTISLDPNTSEDFTMVMGLSSLLFNLVVDSGPCDVEGFATPLRDEPNPYLFKALDTHLSDDGTTFLSDGSSIKGRRYSVLMNLEDIPTQNMYWRLTNRKNVASTFTITLSFLPLET